MLFYYECANASLNVYNDKWNPDKEFNFPEIDMRMVMYRNTYSHTVIAVRGTANLENVKRDAQYKKHMCPILAIPFHYGFYHCADTLWPVIKKNLDIKTPVIFTGHSLGGAVAQICMMFAHVNGFNTNCITFGQPMTTTKDAFSRFCGLNYTRFVNDNDPVPQLPPFTFSQAITGRYRHLGSEYQLNPETKKCNFVSEQQVIKRSRWSFFTQYNNIERHSMQLYLDNMKYVQNSNSN